MTTFCIHGCVLLAGLLMIHSCEQASIGRTTAPPVPINQCGAPTVSVKNGASVKWVNKDSAAPSYIIDFHGTDPTPSPFLVNLNVPDYDHKITAGQTCVQDHHKCDYTYTLTIYKGENGIATPCTKDPVIHVDF